MRLTGGAEEPSLAAALLCAVLEAAGSHPFGVVCYADSHNCVFLFQSRVVVPSEHARLERLRKIGKQPFDNLTAYARMSKETTAFPAIDVSER